MHTWIECMRRIFGEHWRVIPRLFSEKGGEKYYLCNDTFSESTSCSAIPRKCSNAALTRISPVFLCARTWARDAIKFWDLTLSLQKFQMQCISFERAIWLANAKSAVSLWVIWRLQLGASVGAAQERYISSEYSLPFSFPRFSPFHLPSCSEVRLFNASEAMTPVGDGPAENVEKLTES